MKTKIISIKKSNIVSAGLGVFAYHDLRKGLTIGEYKGKVINKQEFEKLKDTRYIFEVNKKINTTYKLFYIDATKVKNSNWLRYVNGAKTREQKKKVNLYAYQYKEKVYYKTTKAIKKGEELLIDYGDSYWL